MNLQETKLSARLEALTNLAGQDATLAHMLKVNRPLTLETYVSLNWPGKTFDQLGAEERSMIPEPLIGRPPDAPQRGSFQTQDEFEEALGYWQSHAGRIKAMVDLATRSKVSPPASGLTVES